MIKDHVAYNVYPCTLKIYEVWLMFYLKNNSGTVLDFNMNTKSKNQKKWNKSTCKSFCVLFGSMLITEKANSGKERENSWWVVSFHAKWWRWLVFGAVWLFSVWPVRKLYSRFLRTATGAKAEVMAIWQTIPQYEIISMLGYPMTHV